MLDSPITSSCGTASSASKRETRGGGAVTWATNVQCHSLQFWKFPNLPWGTPPSCPALSSRGKTRHPAACLIADVWQGYNIGLKSRVGQSFTHLSDRSESDGDERPCAVLARESFKVCNGLIIVMLIERSSCVLAWSLRGEKGASTSNLGRVPGSPSLPLPWWCNPWSLNHDKLTILMVTVYIPFSTFSMPGRGASTVGTEHMPRNWDELNSRISSVKFLNWAKGYLVSTTATKVHLWALCTVGAYSPDHPMDVSLVVSLKLVVGWVASQQSVPGQRHTIAAASLGFLTPGARGWPERRITTTWPPVPTRYLKCVPINL